MKSSYHEDDVVLLLKDITGQVQPQATDEREKLIQSGKHYSEMLPTEYTPTEAYMQTYRAALALYAQPVASAVGVLADKIIKQRGQSIVIVSLARAGTPIGILLKRYLRFKYAIDVPHFSISIIRGRGIDDNAMQYLLARYAPQRLLFVDGWIGKGAILHELQKSLGGYADVSPELAVLSDPANETVLCGTHEDILIPSSCLNSTVSGLISRTVLRTDLIGKDDFHGAVYYGELAQSDLSYHFIQAIQSKFSMDNPTSQTSVAGRGIDEVRSIAAHFGIEDIHLIKPGIGETTRVLLRRVPQKVLVDARYAQSDALKHVLRLASEKGVPVEIYPLHHYQCCGIIKKLADT